MSTTVAWDDVNPNSLSSAVAAVGGYADGLYRWTQSAFARFTTPKKMLYTVKGTPGLAGFVNLIDSEPGNPSPQAAAQWAYDEIDKYRRRSGIYIMSSWWQQGIEAAHALGIGDLVWWDVAHYDNIGVAPPGALCKQYTSMPSYDLTVCDDIIWEYGSNGVTTNSPSAPTPPACISPHGVHLSGHVVGISSLSNGYWLGSVDGGVFAFNHQFDGSEAGHGLNKPIVAIESHPGGGYWLAASDGGVFAFDAPFVGAVSTLSLKAPIMGMASHPSGDGYWLVAGDGGVFAFGKSAYFGGMGGIHLSANIVDIIATPSGLGYWLVGADGAIYCFGDAAFHDGANHGPLNKPIVGGSALPDGSGYYLFGADGGVFAFGNAKYQGTDIPAITKNGWPIVGGSVAGDGNGYAMVAANGAVFAFGDARYQGGL